MPAVTSFEELAMEGLRVIYSAENQALAAYPALIEAATSPDLKQAFQMHTGQTQNQISRLEQIFSKMGGSPDGEQCQASQGLIADAQKHIQEVERGPLLDACLIGAAQKMEHLEIASYGTARTFAQQLGDNQAVQLLEQTLEEEKQTDEKLTQVAQSVVNQQAASQ